MIHRLDPRMLLSVSIAYDTDDKSLHFVGNDRRDSIEFARTSAPQTLAAVVNGEDFEFTDPISLIVIDTGEGADTVILGEITIPCFARGGKGPDSLSGGFGNDTFDGEGGDDYIFGSRGSDSLTGGLQGDSMGGGDDDDDIVAGSSDINDDTISGGDGIDLVDYSTVTDNVAAIVGLDQPDPDQDDFILSDVEVLFGSPQNDTLTNGTRHPMRIDGRAGNDTLTGGSGNDTIVGGDGADSLHGKGGRDSLFANDNGLDTVNGGADGDSAEIDDGLDALFNLEYPSNA